MNKKTILLCVALTSAVASTIPLQAKLDPFFDAFDDFDAPFIRIDQELRKTRHQMNKAFKEMKNRFKQDNFQNRFHMMPKNNVKIKEKDNKAILDIKLGKGVKEIDATIKAKIDGYKKDQLIIKTTKPKKQYVAIKINGRLMSIYHQSEVIREIEKKEKATQKKDKKETTIKKETISCGFHKSSSTITLKHKVDLKKANVEYDEKKGTLKVIIPCLERQEKKIDVTIKK